ncbi:MAG: SgcJ/EcaC family oxidoreductase, partial [Saccharothrix sp.]|nr:SgcJ/EcaC family oxidoreductase [Saccharothrix sp.]
GIPENPSYYRGFTAEDEKAVLTVPMRIQEAWERNDADMFADTFAENGSLLMQDTQLTSREEIRRYMAEGFRGPLKGARVRGGPLEIKFLGDTTAMVISEGGIQLAGETVTAPERSVRVTWVIVKQAGGLKLFSHQSSPLKG